LNRYFIFKKIQNVKADKVFDTIKNSVAIEDKKAFEEKEAFEEAVKDTLKKPTMFVKRLKRKVVLNKYEPVLIANKAESVNMPVDNPQPVDKLVDKKPRCPDGTRRFPAAGPDCYTPEQIEEHRRNKTQKLKK